MFPRAWLGRPLLWAHKGTGNVVDIFFVTLLLPTKDVVICVVSAASGEQGVCPAAGVGEVLGLVEGVGGHGDCAHGAHGAHWSHNRPSHVWSVRTRPAPLVNCDPEPGPHTAHVPHHAHTGAAPNQWQGHSGWVTSQDHLAWVSRRIKLTQKSTIQQ